MSKGMAAPLPFHSPLAAPPLRDTGGAEGGRSSGHGVSPGDRVAGRHCGTGARRASTLRFRCLSIRSRASRLPHPPPQIPGLRI